MHLIIPIIPIILSFVLFVLAKTTDNIKLKLLKIFSVTLFAIYLVRLFSEDVYNNVFNVLLFDVKTPIDPQSTWLFDFGLIPCIVASPFALIIPVGILPWSNEYSFIALQSCFSHMLIFFLVVYSIRKRFGQLILKDTIFP